MSETPGNNGDAGQAGLPPELPTAGAALEYQSEKILVAVKPPRPWAGSEITAWAIILVGAGLVIFSAMMYRGRESTVEGEKLMEMQSTARLLVGMKEMYRMLGFRPSVAAAQTGPEGGTTDAESQTMLDDVDRDIQTDSDRVRAAIVHGEVQGKDEAVRRLKAIGADDPAAAEDAKKLIDIYQGSEPAGSAWSDLLTKYRWFAHLAAGTGKGAGDVNRAAAVGAALRTVIASIALEVGGLAATVAGLILLIVGLVRFYQGKVKLGFSRMMGTATGEVVADRRTYVQAFAWYLGGMALITPVGAVLRSMEMPELLRGLIALAAVVSLMLLPVLMALFWPIIMKQPWRQWRAATGLHFGKGFWREFFAGWLGYLMGMPVLLVGLVMTVILSKVTHLSGSHPINEELQGGPLVIAFAFLLACVWAPFTEELMFRGMLFSHLRERFGWWVSAGLVAVLFASIHPQGIVGIPVLASVAIVLVGIRQWRGSIIGCMAAHMLHNGVALVFAIMVLS